ncbi:MAG: ferrous iron transporter B [Arenimonas sp.]|uniref:ferrous iron transporter B n=1 Tax=Arenimonas sp. TaxID=1872635 RepID=UPI0025C427D7|nr:ferrous iron transporter B [Arenimonas sp.]MBW8367347.1 ferrous iron transporter B [Arenimonas sp.]
MTAESATLNIALVGSPNCGKTALFNRLTGSRQKVANYAGVTVERKEGQFNTPAGRRVRVLDLPGAYSLDANSPDEAITRDLCRGTLVGEARPDLLVCVVDATNLRLHLRFVLELRRLGQPMLLVLNLMDQARRRGIVIDTALLQQRLGMPVIETVAIKTGGTQALLAALDETAPAPGAVEDHDDSDLHAQVAALLAEAVTMPERTDRLDDRLDRWLLHPVFGLVILAGVMFLMFQAVFAWAAPVQDLFAGGIASLGAQLGQWLPEGPVRSLVQDGLFAGLGTVVEFLPQILLLFAFILALEESGYLPRAAFLLDRPMRASGLTGRSFIPLLSSFACAIPGIMATRSIQDPRDRLTTILVAPLMTCSARLPVYTLLISAFIPRQEVLGVFNLQGLVMFALYAAGIVSALGAAWVIKALRRDDGEHVLLLELPGYRLPQLRDLAIGLWERASIFLRRVTGIILSLTVLLWFLSSYPSPPEGAVGPAIDYSLAGRIGHWMQPFFAPIGFNWQICIALIPGLAAREVAVAALATVYAISASGDDAAAQALSPLIAADWSVATALSLLVWYVYAPQCLSTIAVIKRETNSWKQAGIATFYLFALAYLASFITYQTAAALL